MKTLKTQKKGGGYTLIELMIVVVIVAIFLTIAIPAYQNYTRKAKRSDGMDALMTIQQLQERYRANHPNYGTLSDIGYCDSCVTAYSLEDHYQISMSVGLGTDTDARISYQATAAGQGDQANDKVDGTTCTLVVTVNQSNPRGAKSPTVCW